MAKPDPAAPAVERREGAPALPWSEAAEGDYAPGEPDRDYRPVFTPDVATLPYRLADGVKVMHLVAEPVVHNITKRLEARLWGFNGTSPGPTIEVMQNDRVRIYVTNRLPAPTSIHWHGQRVPNGMDGFAGLTQPPIMPGETFKYEFYPPDRGTFMYHSHFDAMTQDGIGMIGMFIVHPREPEGDPPDRDFVILLHEMFIPGGASRPNPLEMADFNVLTMNGRAFPDTYPLVAQRGDRVRIRIGNLSAMSHHPIHLHGHSFRVTATDGGTISQEGRWPETTVLVQVGSTRDIQFVADNPGDWIMHCHMTHHTMNQMGHNFPNMLGAEVPPELKKKMQRLVPGFMVMGDKGMVQMTQMNMRVPPNTMPMYGLHGQFARTVFGGMATVLKVREHALTYEDPGWYDFPPNGVARPATSDELRRDGLRAEH
jgi:FtsP/CotA-like multicopper oxidase with cupredoxin domain